MPSPNTPALTSAQLFQAAPKITQTIIKELLNTERSVMHMRRREDIHQNLVQIVKKHIIKSPTP